MERKMTLEQLDKKYGRCRDYFSQMKITWGIRSTEEVEAEYNRRMKETDYVKDRLQRIYYTLYDRKQLSAFGRLLVEHGVYSSFYTARKIMINGFAQNANSIARSNSIERKLRIIKLYPIFLKQYTRKKREKGSK